MKLLRRLTFFLVCLLPACVSPPEVQEPDWRQVNLVDQDNKKVTLQDYRGTYVLLNFVFTRCPVADMCPLTMSLSKKVLKKWKEEFPDKPLRVVNMTLDPNYDTPEVLHKFGTEHGVDFNEFLFITGERDALATIAAEFNIAALPGVGGLIAHNLKTILLSPELKELEQFKDNEWTPETILNRIKTRSMAD